MEIRNLERVPLKEVFAKEDEDFTPWLASHLDDLSKAVGVPMDAATVQREVTLETLRPDIIVYTSKVNGDEVIIENQYDKSDNAHIGKLLSYAAHEKKAKYAILVTENARKEHKEAVEALNEKQVCGCYFFIVEARCYRMTGETSVAITYNLVAGKKDFYTETEKQTVLRRFWNKFISYSKKKIDNPFYKRNLKANKDNWLSGYIGISNVHFEAKITKSEASVAFLFDSNDEKVNARRYAILEKDKDRIDAAFGKPLLWINKAEKKRCKIEYVIKDFGGYGNESQWGLLIETMISAATRLNDIIKPYYPELKV